MSVLKAVFPVDSSNIGVYNITGSVFTTTALTVWWPSDRRFKAIPHWLNFFFFARSFVQVLYCLWFYPNIFLNDTIISCNEAVQLLRIRACINTITTIERWH